jgi:hypothetical protein
MRKIDEMAWADAAKKMSRKLFPEQYFNCHAAGFKSGAMAVIDLVRSYEGDYAADRIRETLGLNAENREEK